jgi:hypothetical protein
VIRHFSPCFLFIFAKRLQVPLPALSGDRHAVIRTRRRTGCSKSACVLPDPDRERYAIGSRRGHKIFPHSLFYRGILGDYIPQVVHFSISFQPLVLVQPTPLPPRQCPQKLLQISKFSKYSRVAYLDAGDLGGFLGEGGIGKLCVMLHKVVVTEGVK